jgi:hypothetical protein
MKKDFVKGGRELYGEKENRLTLTEEVFWVDRMANKRMVLTLPARGSFGIIARHTRLGGGVSLVLPHTARAGRTCEALAIYRLR